MFLGTSGCGKTTLMRMVNAMVTPTSGSVFVRDQDVAGEDPVRLRRSIGYVLQEGGLFPHRSIADNIATVPHLEGTTKQASRERALELLATQGLVSIPEGGGDVNINTVTKLKNFDFREVEGPQLVRSLDDFDYAVINGNFAQEGGKSISSDALVVESPVDNPAVNVLVWKNGSAKAETIAKLEQLLHSDEVKQYIEQTWPDGSVIPAF